MHWHRNFFRMAGSLKKYLFLFLFQLPDSNPGRLGAKCERYRCAMPSLVLDPTGVQTHTFLICSLQFYPFSHNFGQLTRVDLPLAMPPRRPTSSPFRIVRDTSLSPDFPVFPESFAGFREKAQLCSSKAACLSSTEPSCVGGKIRVSSKWPILTQLNLLSRL